jgi:hypothetical protein
MLGRITVGDHVLDTGPWWSDADEKFIIKLNVKAALLGRDAVHKLWQIQHVE